jgi:hypothetical protein
LGRLKGFIKPYPHSPHEEDTQQLAYIDKRIIDFEIASEVVHKQEII